MANGGASLVATISFTLGLLGPSGSAASVFSTPKPIIKVRSIGNATTDFIGKRATLRNL
jgi:hypothetical protein